jgi:uncharacterized protein (PEP-CTERM system associated)
MNRLNALLAGILIGMPLMTDKLLAAEWERGAGLALGAEFSDNFCLSDDDKISRGFATVTPDIRLRGRGARANVSLNGSVRYNSLGDSDFRCPQGQRSNSANREKLLPRLSYFGDLELIEDWLTLESDASARTTSIDPFAPGNINRIDGRDNVNVVYQYGAGARIQRRLFNSADMRLRYNYNEQQNDTRVLGDSRESRGEFDLGTDRANNRLTLGISGRYSKVMNDGSASVAAFDNTLSSAEARASLRLSSSWQLSVMGGEEWNEFISLQPDIDGTYWDASVRWSPNDRVAVDVGTGERFFGTTPRMSIRYTHKRSELSANYNRSVTLPRDLRASGDRFDIPFDPDFDPDFDPGFDPDDGAVPGILGNSNGVPTFIGSTPVINERLRLGYRYSGMRTTVSLTVSDSRQRRLEDLSDATFSAVGLLLNRTLSSTLSAYINMNLSEREGRGGSVGVFSEPTQTWRGVFGINRRLGSSTTLNLSFQYNRRESDSELNNYTENRVVLSARHQF